MSMLQDRADELLAEPLARRLPVDELRDRAAWRARRRRRRIRAGVGVVVVAIVVVVALVAWRRPPGQVVRTAGTAPAAPVEGGSGHLITLLASGPGPLLVERSARTGAFERVVTALPSPGPTTFVVPRSARVAYLASSVAPSCPAPGPGSTVTCHRFGYVEEVSLSTSTVPVVHISDQAASAIAVRADGSQLAWASDAATGSTSIWVRDLRTGRQHVLVTLGSPSSSAATYVSDLSYSPDGRRLAVSVSDSSGNQVETIETDGPPTSVALVGPQPAGVAWSSAVFRGNDQLVVVATTPGSASPPAQLVAVDLGGPGGAGTRPVLAPGQADPFARAYEPIIQLAAGDDGQLFALASVLCSDCSDSGGWGLYAVPGDSIRTLATGSNLMGMPVSSQVAVGVAWVP